MTHSKYEGEYVLGDVTVQDDVLQGILTWMIVVDSEQLSLFYGRVGDSTTLVNSYEP